MNPFEWYEQQSNAVQLLVVVPVVVALAGVGMVVLTFVMPSGGGLGGSSAVMDAPSISLSIDVEGDDATVTHAGGDAVNAAQLQVVVAGQGRSWAARDDAHGPGDEVTVGDSLTLSGVSAGDTVEFVWISPDGGESVRIASFTI